MLLQQDILGTPSLPVLRMTPVQVTRISSDFSNSYEFATHRFMRVASYVMCEKHSVKNAVTFGVLYNGVAGIPGQVGITDIYRGGMDLYRYRADGEEPAQVPNHGQIAEFALFAVGYRDKDAVKVKLERKAPKGEKFRVSWDKTFEIDGSCLAQHASQTISDSYPFFDYVSAFVKAIKNHENFKAKGKNP